MSSNVFTRIASPATWASQPSLPSPLNFCPIPTLLGSCWYQVVSPIITTGNCEVTVVAPLGKNDKPRAATRVTSQGAHEAGIVSRFMSSYSTLSRLSFGRGVKRLVTETFARWPTVLCNVTVSLEIVAVYG